MILLSQPNKNRNSFYKFHKKYPNPTSLQTHCGPSEMTLNNILPVQFIRFSKFLPKNIKENQTNEKPGAHQMEPPSPIQALGVNPFPSRFIIRTVPRGRANHNDEMTLLLYFIKQQEIRCWQAKHNHKLVKRDFSVFIPQRFSLFFLSSG